MAEVHVLTQNGRKLRLVLHIPIPGGSNSASVLWQDALKNSGLVKTSVLVSGDGTNGTISAAEAASLANGSIFEREIEHDMGNAFDGLNAAGKNAQVDAVYNAAKAELQALLQERLKYCGYTRPVP